MGFELDGAIEDLNRVLSDVAEQNIGKESVILRKVTLDILSQTVKNTRVDTGALRNNWQVSRNLRNKTKELTVNGKSVINAVSSQRMIIRKIDPKDVVYIQNNLDYAETYERKDHMLRNAVNKVMNDLDEN